MKKILIGLVSVVICVSLVSLTGCTTVNVLPKKSVGTARFVPTKEDPGRIDGSGNVVPTKPVVTPIPAPVKPASVKPAVKPVKPIVPAPVSTNVVPLK